MLLEAERQRVMIESLGAVRHHLGQPITVIKAYLEFMDRKETSPEWRRMIEECLHAADAVADILQRLRRVVAYQTELYLPGRSAPPTGGAERILKI